MTKRNDILRLDLRDPENVIHAGHDYGGPLKLFHRTDTTHADPVHDEYLVIKWPAYTQWSGRGARASSKTEYWLVKVTSVPNAATRYTVVERIKSIEPGRKRSLVSALTEEADTLYHEKIGLGDALGLVCDGFTSLLLTPSPTQLRLCGVILDLDDQINSRKTTKTARKSYTSAMLRRAVELVNTLVKFPDKAARNAWIKAKA